eukprot:2806134-Rhodomonas_salina.2
MIPPKSVVNLLVQALLAKLATSTLDTDSVAYACNPGRGMQCTNSSSGYGEPHSHPHQGILHIQTAEQHIAWKQGTSPSVLVHLAQLTSPGTDCAIAH